MIKILVWLVAPALWAWGGYKNHWIRRIGVPLVLTLLCLPLLKWWSFLFFGLLFGATTLPYGTEKTDLPRFVCGLAYAIPLVFIAYFRHSWLLWGVQVLISSLGSHFVNNWLNTRIKWHSDRITEFLTAFFSYCLIPFLI